MLDYNLIEVTLLALSGKATLQLRSLSTGGYVRLPYDMRAKEDITKLAIELFRQNKVFVAGTTSANGAPCLLIESFEKLNDLITDR